MKNLAFGYVRRSSYKQLENNSVEIQKGHIQEFARRKGMQVPDDFIFIEDVTSAFSKRANKRKELMRLQQMMIEMKVNRVIFYEESRMDRTGYSFVIDFLRPLAEKLPDVEVYTTNSESPFNPYDPQTQLAFALYRQESEIKSERAIGNLIADLESDMEIRPGSKVPYGYNQINKKLVPNEKSEIVTFIYYLHSWGYSIGKIASILNDATIPSPTGIKWRSSTVEKILKNPVYTGKLIWNVRKSRRKSDIYEFNNIHEPLIDPLFLHINANNIKLQNQFGRLDTPFLFLNKLNCHKCNSILQTQNGSTTRSGKKYYYQYYVCKNCNYKVSLNDMHEKLVPIVLNHVKTLATSHEIQAETISYLNKVSKVLYEKISNTSKRIDKIERKGSIAKEHNDRELELAIANFKTKYIANLESLKTSLATLEVLHESVQSNMFFSRFESILEEQLSDIEIRLVILYFVDKVFISPEHPFQILYRKNIAESFNLKLDG